MKHPKRIYSLFFLLGTSGTLFFILTITRSNPTPTYYLEIAPKTLHKMFSDYPKNRFVKWAPEKVYYPAHIITKSHRLTVNARPRGASGWHWFFENKSWRIKFPRGHLHEGARRINLIPPRTGDGVLEVLQHDIAGSLYKYTPECEIVQVVFNGKNHGATLKLDQVNGDFLKKKGLLHGDIFYGDVDKPENIFAKPWLWDHNTVNEDNFNARLHLNEMLQLSQGTTEVFSTSFGKYMNITHYAQWLALFEFFGSGHHSYRHNHKYYLNPKTRLFSPFVWGILFIQADKTFNYITNDIAKQFLLQPEFRLLKNKLLWKSLSTWPLDRVQEHYDNILSTHSQVIQNSPFKRHFLLPISNATHKKWVERVRKLLALRINFLKRNLDDCRVFRHIEDREGKAIYDYVVAGHVPARLTVTVPPEVPSLFPIAVNGTEYFIEADSRTLVWTLPLESKLLPIPADTSSVYHILDKKPERQSYLKMLPTHYRLSVPAGFSIECQFANAVTGTPIDTVDLQEKSTLDLVPRGSIIET